jgi:hypothetical protein
MKPTPAQTLQFARDAGLVVRAGEICPEWMGSVSEGYFDLAAVAYEAGVEKGKADYEREHLRHTAPLPDALVAMQNQVAEACAKAANEACATNRVLISIRTDWRKYWEGKP